MRGGLVFPRDDRAAPVCRGDNGLVIGLWSVVLWILARRFTKTDAGADLVVFLNMASVPVLTGCLVISSGIHAIGPAFDLRRTRPLLAM